MENKTKSKNKNLHDANRAKQDEFYTQLTDIEKELQYYTSQFENKIVYCNCDDPYESNFFKYFAMRFNFLGLKKLIATCYIGSPISNKELVLFDNETAENKTTKVPHKIIINEFTDENKDGAEDLQDIVLSLAKNKNNTLTRLNGDGDFRSAECIDFLREADIVVTNPPFSLFREYVAQLLEYDKKFIIIGNKNALTYKEIFSLIKNNQTWVGYTSMSTDLLFDIPDYYKEELIENKKEGSAYKIIDGKFRARASAIWFTNLEHSKRNEELILWKEYNEKDFPKYDNYDAIEVSKTIEIPKDYDGVMGVPISFMDKYNPNQFEIIGQTGVVEPEGLCTEYKGGRPYINDKRMYSRIFIKAKDLRFK